MEYIAHLACLWAIYAMQAIALNLLVGEMGLLSLCHAAFFGLGAYTAGVLSAKLGMSLLLSTLIAPFCVAVIAAVIAFALYRLHGDFFALATFGISLIFYSAILHWSSLTGGAFGLIIPFPFELSIPRSYLLILPLWGIVFSLMLLYSLWRKSPFGRILNAMREDEILAESLGKPVRYYRLITFIWTAAISGLAGTFYVWLIGVIDPTGFTVIESIMLIAMIIIGGPGSNIGALLGSSLVIVLPELLRFIGIEGSGAANIRRALFGLMLYLVIVYRPKGLLGRFSIGLEKKA